MAKKKTPEIRNWETELVALIDEEWEKGSTYCSDLNELYDDVYAMLRGERPSKS